MLTVATTASASPPFVQTGTSDDGAIVWGQSPLEVVSARLAFRRTEGATHAAPWTFEARYRVHNPTDVEVETLGAFYSVASEPSSPRSEARMTRTRVTIELDGRDVRTELSAEVDATMDARLRSLDPMLAQAQAVERTGYRFSVPPRRSVELVFRGRLAPSLSLPPAYDAARAASSGRHLVFTERPREDGYDEYRYLISPIREWARFPAIQVEVAFPSELDVEVAGTTSESVNDRGETVVETAVDVASPSYFTFREMNRADRLTVGGPFVGIGGQLDEQSFRVRIGYELAFPRDVLYAIAIETNFDDRAVLVPTVELATPMLLFVPSLGLGTGIPIRVRHDDSTQVGVRVQATISVLAASVIIPLDVFPLAERDRVEVSMMGQLSF